ncbi:unnamed protein product, partial [Ascophyllum nodosum]
DVEASYRTKVHCRSGDYAGYRRAKNSRQTKFFCEDRGAAVLVARCCCQERGHDIDGSGEDLTVCTSVITSCISLVFYYLAEIFSVDIL